MIPGKPTPKEITRADRHDVRIVWSDGHESTYVARELRLQCPCAACVQEMSGRPLLDASSVTSDVHPLGIAAVGRYAIHIQWSDGHATGIYTFDRLRELCGCRECVGK